MKDWKNILRRVDIILEMERFKDLQQVKDKKKKYRAKTNAQIDAEKIRMAEYQESLARQLSAKQIARSKLEKIQQVKTQIAQAIEASYAGSPGWINGSAQGSGTGETAEIEMTLEDGVTEMTTEDGVTRLILDQDE